MPPKRGRGRGRGGPSRQDQTPPVTVRPGDEDQPAPWRRAAQQTQHLPLTQPAGSQPVRQEAPQLDIVQRRQEGGAKQKARTVQPEELGIELKHKLLVTPALPRRPNTGRLGRSIKLIANCFPVDVPSGYLYHYDVDIIEVKRNMAESASTAAPVGSKSDKKYRCLSTKRNREVINFMLKSNANFQGLFAAYDGRKNLYTRKPLKIKESLKCRVIIPNEDAGSPNDPRGPRTDEFDVHIKPVKKKDTDSCAISLDALHALFRNQVSEVPQEAIMALETVLRHKPCMEYVPIGRSFFYKPNPQDLHPLGGGREIWFGYHQSLRLGQWKPLVNLDITATTFYEKGPILKYIAGIIGTSIDTLRQRPHLNDAEIKKISKELKNMRIEVTHLNYRRKYRIFKLTRESAVNLQFTYNENGNQTRCSVAEYFRRHHNISLRYPHLPCLQVNPETKKVYLPVEVCEMIEGQHCKKKLEERQNAEMIKFTARSPRDRFGEINDIVRRADFNHDPYLGEFNMKVYCEPLKLEGRVIEAPNVRYDNETRIRPRDGSWDMRDKRFFRGAEINSWVLISFSEPRFCGRDKLDNFARLLHQIGKETGIQIDRPSNISIIDSRRDSVKNVLANISRQYAADLAVIVVPSRNKSIYGEIKQAAETILGLTTQCVKDENVARKCNPPLVSNLCQKINAKMGGVNNSLSPGETPAILRRPVIFIGADVTHPSPSHDIKPSLAAAVGSLDAHPSRYAVTCRAQTNVDENKQAIEIILDLKNMVMDLLKAFYRNTGGKKPEKIIFFRDGVSEGQFEKVRDHEVKCIREACRTLDENYQPGVTFIVVQKRHHTRFMPQDSREGVGRMKNIPPGTTVDTAVTHPLNFDFYLCSHFGLQGTSRPSHYTVIEDDNEFTADDLQKLTYYLCHTYVRCTKSISTPSPVAYAHLAAFRARQHLLSLIDESSGGSESSSTGYHPLPDAVINAIKVVDGLKNTMYFV